MLTESVALSCCGAVLGLLLAVAGTRAIAHLDAFNLPLLASVRIDGDALGFTPAGGGRLPEYSSVCCRPWKSLARGRGSVKDAGRGSSGGPGRAWVRNGLVVSEIAFACALLVGAGLLMRSFLQRPGRESGISTGACGRAQGRSEFSVRSLEQQNSFVDEMLRRTRALPGIQAAGFTDCCRLEGTDRGRSPARDRFTRGTGTREPSCG